LADFSSSYNGGRAHSAWSGHLQATISLKPACNRVVCMALISLPIRPMQAIARTSVVNRAQQYVLAQHNCSVAIYVHMWTRWVCMLTHTVAEPPDSTAGRTLQPSLVHIAVVPRNAAPSVNVGRSALLDVLKRALSAPDALLHLRRGPVRRTCRSAKWCA
jgi:hypothetical protein